MLEVIATPGWDTERRKETEGGRKIIIMYMYVYMYNMHRKHADTTVYTCIMNYFVQ